MRKYLTFLLLTIILIFPYIITHSAPASDCRDLLGTWDIVSGSNISWIWKFDQATMSLAKGQQIDRGNDGWDEVIWAVPGEKIGQYIIYEPNSDYTIYHYVRINGDIMDGYYYFLDFYTEITGTKRPYAPPCPAAMVLGDDEESLEVLRWYRDEVLSKTAHGQKLIDLYYATAPALSRILAERPELKKGLKSILQILVPYFHKVVN